MTTKMSPETVALQNKMMRLIGEYPLAYRRSEDDNAKEDESTRQAIARAQRLQDEREAISAQDFEKIIAELQTKTRCIKPMTPTQEEQFQWLHRVAPKLKSLGLEDKHIRIISPNWNCLKQARVFEDVKRLCTMSGSVVALVGARGTGKTTIAAQLMRERADAESAWYHQHESERTGQPPLEPGRYAKLSQLGMEFKPLYADFGSLFTEALTERLEAWSKLPLLVLDEIHESEDLKTQMRMLADLVDRRYARKVDTILISNHDAQSFKAEMNSSILSRISEHGAIIECAWDSWRTRTMKAL